MERAYFLTIAWYDKGRRGIFCDADGQGFRKDNEPHTEQEIYEILGPFEVVLAPKSELLTAEQIAEFNFWVPMGGVFSQFGVALNKNKERAGQDDEAKAEG